MAIKIPLKGLEDNINNFARIGLNRAAERVKERLEQNAGLTDHSLEELAALGHPYNTNNPDLSIHTPAWLVHTHTHKLKDNIKITKEDKDHIAIGVDTAQVGYALWVIEGTSKLVPRDFPHHTLKELEDNRVIENTMEAAIQEGIKRS